MIVLRKYEIKHLCPDSSRYFCQSEITEIDLIMYCIFYLHDEKCYKPMHIVLQYFLVFSHKWCIIFYKDKCYHLKIALQDILVDL